MKPFACCPILRTASVVIPLLVVGCGSSTPQPSTTAAAVSGPDDTHCGTPPNLTTQTVGDCVTNDPPTSTASCGVNFVPAPADGGAPVTVDYGPTLYNATGYDDDCKYQLSWTATPVVVNAGVTFTVTATYATSGMPVHCAGIAPEVYIEGTSVVAVPTGAASEIGTSGKYAVGPIRFTQSGMWTVRFHLFEECGDEPVDSPHGHGAFFVNVP